MSTIPACSVCGGIGTPVSGRPCICGGRGTEAAELDGFRQLCYTHERTIEALEAERKALPRRLAYALWETSKLRHGLFTPPEFIDLCDSVIREVLVSKPSAPSTTQ